MLSLIDEFDLKNWILSKMKHKNLKHNKLQGIDVCLKEIDEKLYLY